MKLVLLLAAGALAAQDTTPPVLSLSLHDTEYLHRNCKDNADGDYPCTRKSAAHAQALQSATCEVGTDATKCPEPTCVAYDHHDMHCKDGVTGCPAAGTDELVDFCLNGGTSMDADRCTHEFDCIASYRPINIDGTNQPVPDEGDEFDGISRNQRSEWLITFSQSDVAGNPAEPVSFTMIFQDTMPPSIVTEFGTNPGDRSPHNGADADRNTEHNEDSYTLSVHSPQTQTAHSGLSRDFAESCTERQADLDAADDFTGTGASPCVYLLNTDQLRSVDKYDGDPCGEEAICSATPFGSITANMEMKIANPSGTVTQAYTHVGDLSSPSIDTRIEGMWVVTYRAHDNADMFGWKESDNVAHQRVQIHVSDNRAPTLYVQDYTGAAGVVPETATLNGDAKNPTIECSSASDYLYVDPAPGALSEDLRESWDSAQNKWVFEQITMDQALPGAVNLQAVSGTTCTKTDTTCYMEFVVTYSDSDGSIRDLPATIVKRSIRVEDTTPPVITLKDHDGVNLSDGDDGEITSSAGVDTHANGKGFDGGHAGCAFDADSCVVHNADGSEHLLKGEALKEYCEANADNCHSSGFFDTHQLTVGVEGATPIGWIKDETDYTYTAGVGGDDSSEWRGAGCTDTCDQSPTLMATLFEGKDCSDTNGVVGDGQIKNFPEYRKGWYSIRYVCTDGNSGDSRQQLISHVCRNINNVDNTRPVIQVLGANHMVLEATHAGNYVDDGATCYDQVDGVISQNVEVSGDVVNLSKVGTYTIEYNCRDSAGNTAPVASRTVVVEQTTCPTCTMEDCTGVTDCRKTGAERSCVCTLNHEASFPYTDAGAACSDKIDGDLQVAVTNPVNVEKTGTYVVTYKATNSVGLTNDADACGTRGLKAQEYLRTVVVQDTLKPVVEVLYNGVRVARGSATDKAVHNPSLVNPVGADDWTPAGVIPSLMAEAASVSSNAWLLAGVATAVTGLALLTVTQRRSAVATSVPV